MTFNLDGFRSIREDRPSARETWRPPTINDLGFDIVIAFDQTLAATAAMCVHRHGDALAVRGVKMLSGHSNATGDEGNLQKGVSLYHDLTYYLAGALSHHAEGVTVVHEAPSVGGGTLHRPESSLLAAQALRLACDRIDIPVAPMVSSSAHKKAICGDGRATKNEAHEALAELAESLPIQGYQAVRNSDKRDALCIAITHLMRSK